MKSVSDFIYLKPKVFGYSSNSFFSKVDLPDPDGPHTINGLGPLRNMVEYAVWQYNIEHREIIDELNYSWWMGLGLLLRLYGMQ